MKKYLTISLALVLGLSFQLVFAADLNEETKTPHQEQQEGNRKSNQSGIGLDDGYGSQTQDEQELTSDDDEITNVSYSTSEVVREDADSVEDDSVSKYNFIFYFLYKFKYDSEESP